MTRTTQPSCRPLLPYCIFSLASVVPRSGEQKRDHQPSSAATRTKQGSSRCVVEAKTWRFRSNNTHKIQNAIYEPSVGRTRASVVKTNKASKTPNVSQTECRTTIRCSKIAQLLYSRTWLLGRPSGLPSLFHSGLLVVGEPCRMTAGERWCGTRDGREAGKPVQNALFSSLEGFLHPTLL